MFEYKKIFTLWELHRLFLYCSPIMWCAPTRSSEGYRAGAQICLLCSRLFNLFYFKYFAKHKAYKRRAFYNYYLQNLTPCSFSYQAAPQNYQENYHNKSKAPLGQQTRGYYSCGKGYRAFAPRSTTVHRINSFSKAYSYFYITQQDLLCDN